MAMKLKSLLLSTLLWAGVAPAAIALPAVLVVEEGTVRVRPEGWLRAGWGWAVRRSGSALEGTDLLQPEPGSRAFVRCPDNPGTKTPIPANLVSSVNNLCNRAAILHRPSNSWSTVTGGADPEIPYVITPRQGTVATDRPRLQWNPVAGATEYTVTLRRSGQDSWTITTNQSDLDYPAAFPALVGGQFYQLEVVADTGRASTEEEGAVFNYLAELPAELAQLDRLELPPGVEAVERARIYLEAGMGSGALAVLLGWEPEPEEVALRQWLLGEVYGALNLRDLAIEAYGRAWAGAVLPADLGVAVDAAMAMGWLQEGEPGVAVQWWRRAELGAAYGCDGARLAEIWGQLAALEPGFERPEGDLETCGGR